MNTAKSINKKDVADAKWPDDWPRSKSNSESRVEIDIFKGFKKVGHPMHINTKGKEKSI